MQVGPEGTRPADGAIAEERQGAAQGGAGSLPGSGSRPRNETCERGRPKGAVERPGAFGRV
eukprot:1335939-Pyramimonas_sp.AAC.1